MAFGFANVDIIANAALISKQFFRIVLSGSWFLNLNTLYSQFDIPKTMLSLIFLRRLLKMFVSCFLASNIFLKYSRDLVTSFFCVVVKFCIRLMNNIFKNL